MKKTLNLILMAVLATAATQSFAAGKVLADRHGDRGIGCQMCHKVMPPKKPSNDDCFMCHKSYAEVAKRTNKKDINPHDTHVEDASCSDCHSGHKKPKLLCDQCHEFTDIKVP